MAAIALQNKIHKKNVKSYRATFRNHLMTSRFNNTTWKENQRYRQQHPDLGCVYCSPEPITQGIPEDSILFVLEMNNETNQILGIGMVRNHPIVNRYNVYQNGNYNRYVYTGKSRIDRTSMTEFEEKVMKIFDILCFSGNHHMKRGQGIKSFPVDMLYRCSKRMDLVKFICEMFKNRLRNQQTFQ